MRVRSLGHVPDHVLVADLASLVRRDRALTCELLLHLGEVDARRLFLPAAYPSMHAYCVGELRLSEAAALKRIRVARAARRFPALLAALEDGRLTLTTALLLTPHLESERAEALITAAEGLSRAGIERLIAVWHAPTEGETVAPGPAGGHAGSLAPGPVERECDAADAGGSGSVGERAAGPALVLTAPGPPSPGGVDAASTRARLTPIGSGRVSLTASIDEETHELLRYAQTLLGHAVPSGDLSQILKRAAAALVEQLEKRRFAKSARSRPARAAAAGPEGRHIPAAVRGAVWERDGGRCTFVSEAGRRCDSDVRLEFDHVVPVARGGASTAANLRLLCRAHNQHAAERTFGEGFMRRKRERGASASGARTEPRGRAAATHRSRRG